MTSPTKTPTLAQTLQVAQASGLTRLDAQLLLLHTLGRDDDRAWLWGHDQSSLPAAAQAHFASLCQRRLAGEPVAYLVGCKEFFGLSLAVDARVLVPRPDTETLVEWALELWPQEQAPRVVDLGTGSGAIALALAHTHPQAQIHASDRSHGALAVAQDNALSLGLRVQWHSGHWWQAFANQRFDMVLSNPPYIREDDAHLQALRAEPLGALTSGSDGLHDLREIITQAGAHLNPGAWLLLEHGYDQAPAVAALLRAAGFSAIDHRQDLAGHVRCTGGQWPPPAKAR
jgi:release factor glutamine methyltransferase